MLGHAKEPLQPFSRELHQRIHSSTTSRSGHGRGLQAPGREPKKRRAALESALLTGSCQPKRFAVTAARTWRGITRPCAGGLALSPIRPCMNKPDFWSNTSRSSGSPRCGAGGSNWLCVITRAADQDRPDVRAAWMLWRRRQHDRDFCELVCLFAR